MSHTSLITQALKKGHAAFKKHGKATVGGSPTRPRADSSISMSQVPLYMLSGQILPAEGLEHASPEKKGKEREGIVDRESEESSDEDFEDDGGVCLWFKRPSALGRGESAGSLRKEAILRAAAKTAEEGKEKEKFPEYGMSRES